MDPARPRRRSWLLVTAAAAVWILGAYIPTLSNLWVTLNILAPAGQPHAATFPMAYPPVGVDGHTLCSLLGLLLVLGAAVRWITYLERYTPPPPAPAPLLPPAPATPAPAAPAPRPNTTTTNSTTGGHTA